MTASAHWRHLIQHAVHVEVPHSRPRPRSLCRGWTGPRPHGTPVWSCCDGPVPVQSLSSWFVVLLLDRGVLTACVDRIDPLVEPGIAPSAHLHQIVGGNSFNTTMEPGVYDPAEKSTCTSCTYSEDFSNYWTAGLYFKAANGSLKRY